MPDEKERVADDLIISIAELKRQFEQLKSDMVICRDRENQSCDSYPVALVPTNEIIDLVAEEQDCLLFG